MKKIFVFLLVMFFLIVGAGCGASQNKSGADSSNGNGAAEDGKTPTTSDEGFVPAMDSVFTIDKVIHNGRIDLYTDNYKVTVNKITAYVKGLGGFIQSSNDAYVDENNYSLGSTGYMVIRVPSAKFEDSMDVIKSYGRSVGSSTSSENITETYKDVESELKSLKIEEERLLVYLTKADKIADMLTIETELNRVRTEINSRTSILNNYDKQVAYSTITINLTEDKSATGKIDSPFSDFGQKIMSGFVSSINVLMSVVAGFILVVFQLLPFLIIVGVVLLIVWFVRKKNKKQ